MYYQENYNTIENLLGISAGTEDFFNVSQPGRQSFYEVSRPGRNR